MPKCFLRGNYGVFLTASEKCILRLQENENKTSSRLDTLGYNHFSNKQAIFSGIESNASKHEVAREEHEHSSSLNSIGIMK